MFVICSLKQTKQGIQHPDRHPVRWCLLEVIIKILYSPQCGSYSHNTPDLLGEHVKKETVSLITYQLQNTRDVHEKVNIAFCFLYSANFSVSLPMLGWAESPLDV